MKRTLLSLSPAFALACAATGCKAAGVAFIGPVKASSATRPPS
jgi:hypothetical protein